MNQKQLELCKNLVNRSYIDLASQSINQFNKLLESLLNNRRLPDEGWTDRVIEHFLGQISMMDSNNFLENVGVGEREGRVYNRLVQDRHFGLAHGIGRSGDITEQQPKAAGSSLLQKLTRYLVRDAMRLAGIEDQAIGELLVLPLATGMTLSLTLLTLAKVRPATARYVIVSRIDQKSCLKSVISANLTPIVVDGVLSGDAILTNVEALRKEIETRGADNILCVMTTTSCFAPRVPDDVVTVGRLCKEMGVGHVINNAYGLQCTKITHLVSQACKEGRVDAFVQSTDKNFMVPVGGAIVASPNKEFIDFIAKNYPGRASGSPQLDLIITLLSMGKDGWTSLLKQRKDLLPYFLGELDKVAQKHGWKVLQSKDNKISVALGIGQQASSQTESVSMIGSKLFSRQCSGARVVEINGKSKPVGGIEFVNYGSHHNQYPCSYLTVACSIGMTKDEIDVFLKRFDSLLSTNK